MPGVFKEEEELRQPQKIQSQKSKNYNTNKNKGNKNRGSKPYYPDSRRKNQDVLLEERGHGFRATKLKLKGGAYGSRIDPTRVSSKRY